MIQIKWLMALRMGDLFLENKTYQLLGLSEPQHTSNICTNSVFKATDLRVQSSHLFTKYAASA